ncbi:MAG: hypothetical protein IKX10_07555, partial [Lachnospiraceae bacterium]|nr:hypothetical protein [Lachnospiraceae bacterium]
MRKITSIALSACLCLALAGCKTDDKPTTAAADTTAAVTAEATTAEAAPTTENATTAAPTTAAPTTVAPTTATPTTAAPLPEDPKYTIPTDMTEKITTQASKHGFTFGGCIGN